MNPLALSTKNRKFYEALVDLHHTDVNDDSWLSKYRKVKRIQQVERKADIVQGWKCFYVEYTNQPIPVEIAEKFL